jgi:hypothetical protein
MRDLQGKRNHSERLSAQANEADIRVMPEPDLVLVLVSGFALLTAFNISRGEKNIRLTLERRKKENLSHAAKPQMGARIRSQKTIQVSENI